MADVDAWNQQAKAAEAWVFTAGLHLRSQDMTAGGARSRGLNMAGTPASAVECGDHVREYVADLSSHRQQDDDDNETG